MTGRQIRLPAILSKVQLFPWGRAIEVIPAVPETAEPDSLFGRARLPQRPLQSSQPLGPQPSPHASACPVLARVGSAPGTLAGTRSLLLLWLSGHLSPATRSSCGTAGLCPTCHLMKGSIYICWEEWPGLAFSQEDFHKIQRQLCLLHLQINCSSSSETQWNQMIHSRSRRKPTSLRGIKCSTWDLYS